jgi:hypothetical protein
VPCTEPAGPADPARAGDIAPAPGRRRLLQTSLALWPVAPGAALLALSGCAQRGGSPAPAPAPPPSAPPSPPAAPGAPSGRAPVPGTPPPAPAQRPAPPAGPLPAPVAARTWTEFQLQAARRLMAANPGRVYDGPVPDPLLAIPVLEVELHADGRVRGIKVLRQPTQARDTVQLAMEAVRRAAPYGSVERLPRPWRFVEVFLFDDERRFKPRTLDL